MSDDSKQSPLTNPGLQEQSTYKKQVLLFIDNPNVSSFLSLIKIVKAAVREYI